MAGRGRRGRHRRPSASGVDADTARENVVAGIGGFATGRFTAPGGGGRPGRVVGVTAHRQCHGHQLRDRRRADQRRPRSSRRGSAAAAASSRASPAAPIRRAAHLRVAQAARVDQGDLARPAAAQGGGEAAARCRWRRGVPRKTVIVRGVPDAAPDQVHCRGVARVGGQVGPAPAATGPARLGARPPPCRSPRCPADPAQRTVSQPQARAPSASEGFVVTLATMSAPAECPSSATRLRSPPRSPDVAAHPRHRTPPTSRKWSGILRRAWRCPAAGQAVVHADEHIAPTGEQPHLVPGSEPPCLRRCTRRRGPT